MKPADSGMRTDVIVAGGGMAGLALAVALKDALGDGLDVTLCDPLVSRRAPTNRTSAIAAGSRQMLESLGIWFGLEDRAQPIREMQITDSRPRDVVRPVYLDFAAPPAGEPLAHMVFNHEIETALADRARQIGVRFREARIGAMKASAGGIAVETDQGALRASLVVAADGARSRLRDLAGIRTIGWDYPVAGIVATVGHEREHDGRASEHFLPPGPFAVLPLTGRRSSLVWTETRARAREILRLPKPELCAEIEQRMGHDLGRIELLDEPSAWPLSLSLARRFGAARFALIGDAAHVVHPLAGQGINLGFRDVAVLAEAIVEQARLGLDPGAPEVLESYEKARRFDVVSMAMSMDAMNRLFASDAAPLRLLRDLGLGLVDRLPEMKRFFMREAGGVTGAAPRLFRGEML